MFQKKTIVFLKKANAIFVGMKKIIAAGGLVFNEAAELLMIYRRGKWDLPKGKLDKGESIENCAVREVQEETGITKIVLGKLIDKTYHEYFDKWENENVIKETWWYKMNVYGNVKLKQQTEEDIEEIIWADKNILNKNLQNSYPTIVELIEKYLQI